jgi:peptide/nickel transport system substrate-binding protein
MKNGVEEMKKRTVLLMVLVAMVTSLVLAGCASDTKNSSNATGEVVKGGELTYALATPPDSLDPHRTGYVVALRVIAQVFDTLITLDEKNEFQPRLATEWNVSNEGKTYTFKLRDDVKFHDGTPFNAEAVKYNFDRIVDPKTKAGNAIALIQDYESAEVLGEFEVAIHLSSPNAAFLSNVSQTLLSIVSPTAAEKYGEEFAYNPVGTGLFKFESYKENAEVKLVKNEDYNWGPVGVENKGPSHLDRLTFKIVPEEATRVGGIQSGQILVAETIPPQNISALEANKEIEIYSQDTIGLPFTLFFNQTNEPYNDVNVRKAILLGVDVDSIIKTLYLGYYNRSWSPLTPGIYGYNEKLENSWNYDVEAANKLLDEAGFTVGKDGIRVRDGKRLTLNYVDGAPNREKRNDIAVIIQQQLKKIGVDVSLNITQDFRTVVYTNADYDLYGNSQINTDPNSLLSIYQKGALLPRGIDDPELDELLLAGSTEQDREKRIDIYAKAQARIIEQAYIIPIYVFPYIVGTTNEVAGFKFNNLGIPILNDVSFIK